ncbi:MAG: hypothetical protein AAF198_06105 [Pseudomonadota bacterium]
MARDYPGYDGTRQIGRSEFPRLRPINFWVRHIAVILGLAGLAYLNSETIGALTKISLEDLHYIIRLLATISYSLVASYFTVHFVLSIFTRTVDTGVPLLPVVVWLIICLGLVGAFMVLQDGNAISAVEPRHFLLLVPFVLIYAIMILPSNVIGTSKKDTSSSPFSETET